MKCDKTEYLELQERKRKYIPQYVNKTLSGKECARLIGITYYSVWNLGKRYKTQGDKIFTHALKGKRGTHCKFTIEQEKAIVQKYKEATNNGAISGAFQSFSNTLNDYYPELINGSVKPSVISNILKRYGFTSPKARKINVVKHAKSRNRRSGEGELLQFDATPYQWFKWCGDNEYYTLHGAIDDASQKITGLYMCKNECRLGYLETLRQIFTKYGTPQSAYTDRSSSFFVNPRKKDLTEEERIELAKKSETLWTSLCKKFSIESIIALSPQAKGRIERFWQTAQGQLPMLFCLNKIKTIEDANNFLESYIEKFNNRYQIETKNKVYKKVDDLNELDYELAIKIKRKTKKYGKFKLLAYDFRVKADWIYPHNGEIVISEKFGIKFRENARLYDVELDEPVTQVVGEQMSRAIEDLIDRFMLADSKTLMSA